MQKNENMYSTSNLSLAATINLFTPLYGIEGVAGEKRSSFLFQREIGLDELIQGFQDGSLRIPPQAYFTSLKIIKDRLYSNERNE